MQYINPTPAPSGAMYVPQSAPAPGLIPFPDEFMEAYYRVGGFIEITITRGVVTAVEEDAEAWEAWKEANPEPEPGPGTGTEPSGDYVKYGELAEAIREGVNSVG